MILSIACYCVHSTIQQNVLGDHCRLSVMSRMNSTEPGPCRHKDYYRNVGAWVRVTCQGSGNTEEGVPVPAVRHRKASPITRELSSADREGREGTSGREDSRCKGPGGEREAELTGNLESYFEWILSCFL